MIITSNSNDIIKTVISLKQKKNRDNLSLFIVEGYKQVSEIPQNWKTKFIVSTEKYKEINKNGFIVSERLFDKISCTKTPQGILAVVEKKKYDIEKVLSDNNGIFVVCDNVQDPGNVGTIIRTAESYSCKGIFLSKTCADVYGDKVVRSSMGAVFNIPVFQECDVVSLIDLFKEKQIKICALSLDGDKVLSKFKIKNNIALIVGNEADGISKDVLNVVDNKIKIEMFGKTQSLNAAVACSLAIYEFSKSLNYDK